MRTYTLAILVGLLAGCAAPADETVLGPSMVTAVKPDYPPASRVAKEQGVTTLRVRVLENGAVGEVVVEESSGSSRLDAAAVNAVRKSEFRPAQTRSGKNVASWARVPIRFVVENPGTI